MSEDTRIESQIDREIARVRREAPFLAIADGYPVSGDALREWTYDPHPTQPFRMGDLLWPLVTVEPEPTPLDIMLADIRAAAEAAAAALTSAVETEKAITAELEGRNRDAAA